LRILYTTFDDPALKLLFHKGEFVDLGMPSMLKPIKALYDKGEELTFIVCSYHSSSIKIHNDRLKIIFIRIPREIILLKGIRKLSFSTINIQPAIEILVLFAKFIKQKKYIKYDIIYGQDIFGIPLGKLIAIHSSKPFITRMYGAGFFRRSNGKASLLNIISLWDKYLPLIIRSDFLLITQDGSLDENQYREINNNKVQQFGIWLNGFDPVKHYSKKEINSLKNRNGIKSSDALVFISTAHMSDWKCVDSVIELFYRFLKDVSDNAYLIMVGDGPMENLLKETVKIYGIEEKVKFVGRVSQNNVYPYLAISDIFFSLHISQNLSNSLWEAMSMGKCVITRSDILINSKYLTNNVNCLLLDIEDEKVMIHNLRMLNNDRSLVKKIGKNAKRDIFKILPTWDERVNKEIKLITNLYNKYYK